MRDPTVIATNTILIWLALMFVPASAQVTKRNELVCGCRVDRYKPALAILIFAPVIYLVAFGLVRYDTYLYLAGYRSIFTSVSGPLEYFQGAKGKGFALFSIACRLLFGDNTTLYRLAICLMHTVPLLFILRRYSENYLFSIYLFIATCCHMSWMMNGLRQFMAATMIFAATPWILEKKYVRAVLVVLLATSFHRSAMMMLPVIFIVQGKPFHKWMLLFSVLTIAAMVVLARNRDAFDTVAEMAGYSIEAAVEAGDDGMNPIRALVKAVPMLLAFMARDRLRDEDVPIISLCVNMSVITFGVSLIAVVTSGIMVGRLLVYTDLWNLILLPHVIHVAFDEGMEDLVRFAAIALYFAYYLYSVGGI